MTFIHNIPINLNISNLSFRAQPAAQNPAGIFATRDSYVSNPIQNTQDIQSQIEQIARSNPRIMELLDKYKLPLKVSMSVLENLKTGHMKETRIVAAQIYSSLPSELKSQVNLKDLQEAAMYHDYGKILIPEEILNKEGELTPEEKEIMELHAELGYELLKNKNLSQNTLRLIKYHHQTENGEGYPAVGEDFEYDLSQQIISAADKYTALREKRSYKEALSKKETLEIINKDGIMPEIQNALSSNIIN